MSVDPQQQPQAFPAPDAERPPLVSSLSGKLLMLTIAFVMVAEVLIFAPSIASMRMRWLTEKLNTAAASSIIIDAMQIGEIPQNVLDETLMAAGARMIVLRKDGTARMLARSSQPLTVYATYDLAHDTYLTNLQAALDTLVFGGDRFIRVFGPIGASDTVIDVVFSESMLRGAMLNYARNVFIWTFLISLITATMVFFTINRLLIRRIRWLTDSIQRFAREPELQTNIIQPEEGRDELAIASRHLAAMQGELGKTLRQQKTMAELGLAVSKINHDMRNILASAQLMGDRLTEAEDPMVRRFAPKLLRTLDRAVGYTREVLAYGQSSEAEPKRRHMALLPLVEDVRDMLGLDPAGAIDCVLDVDPDIMIDADAEQLFRIIHNLARNACQALMAHPADDGRRGRLSISGHRAGSVTVVLIEDNGPGMPQKARENLFVAFRGSARAGGTGLGLAIARELVLAHGGTIALVERLEEGTLFRIEIPDRALRMEQYRARA